MNEYEVIKKALTTEKSSKLQENGQYSFIVSRRATKIDVKKAVKKIYGADAKEVKMMLTPPKSRLVARGRMWTKRPIQKKALVTLKDGKTLDLHKLASEKKKK
jgi:large subunit ribosomal protein L23